MIEVLSLGSIGRNTSIIHGDSLFYSNVYSLILPYGPNLTEQIADVRSAGTKSHKQWMVSRSRNRWYASLDP